MVWQTKGCLSWSSKGSGSSKNSVVELVHQIPLLKSKCSLYSICLLWIIQKSHETHKIGLLVFSILVLDHIISWLEMIPGVIMQESPRRIGFKNDMTRNFTPVVIFGSATFCRAKKLYFVIRNETPSACARCIWIPMSKHVDSTQLYWCIPHHKGAYASRGNRRFLPGNTIPVVF